MGTVLASKIVNDAEDALSDSTNATWTATRLLKWLNLGQREAFILKPDISVSNAVTSSALTEGTKQEISSDGTQFVKLTRNYGTDGATVGDAITYVDMDVMDRIIPTWHTDTGSATVQHYLFDPKDPKHYYVYPPQPSSDQGYVELVEYVTPDDVSAIGNAITIDDVYESVLLDYILFRAYAEDAAHSLYGAQRSVEYWNKFVEALGRKDMREEIDSPKGEE